MGESYRYQRTTRGPKHREVVRSAGAVWLSAALIAVVLLGCVDAARRGDWDFLGTAAPWLVLLAWALALLWITPRVVVDDDGLTVVGVLRVWVIPWAALAGIDSGMTLSLRCKDGSRVRCFGAPGAGIDRGVARRIRPGDLQMHPQPASRTSPKAPSFVIGTRWTAATGGPQPQASDQVAGAPAAGLGPVTRWRGAWLMCGACIVVWGLATLVW